MRSLFACWAGLLWLTGCTLVSDFEVRECTLDDECTLPTGSVQHCERAVCEPGCRDNQQCVSIDPRYPICSAPGGECVRLTDDTGACYLGSEYSDSRMGSLTADQMTIVGAFAPRMRSPTWLTLQLATDELTGAGLFAEQPLLVVVCSDALPLVPVAIEHLDRLGVSAILAPSESAALSAMASLPAPRGSRLFLSPGGYLPIQAAAAPSERVWYVGPSYAGVVEAYAPLIAELAAGVEARRGAPARIALVIGTGEEDRRLAASVRDGIALNGDAADRLQNEDRLHPFELDDFPNQRQRVIAEVAAYAPDLVLWMASGSFAEAAHEERSSAVKSLEALAADRPEWQPVYLFGPRNTEDAALRSLALQSAAFRSRSLGLRSDRAGDPGEMAAFFERFEASFPAAGSKYLALHAAPSAYDAFYYLSYVLSLSRSLGDLRHVIAAVENSATTLAVGPAGFDRAAPLLSGSTPFGLIGTSGPLTFDSADHARSAPVRTYCWTESAQLEDSAEFHAAERRFARSAGRCAGGPFDGG